MTQNQYDTWNLYTDFEKKVKKIETIINEITNQCSGNNLIGYNIEMVQDIKKELNTVIQKYLTLAKDKKKLI